MSRFNNNKFLGGMGGSGSFTNDGTSTLNAGKVQVQTLSPFSLVATDSQRNLISVPYTNTAYFSLSLPVVYPNPDTPYATWNSNSNDEVVFSNVDSLQNGNIQNGYPLNELLPYSGYGVSKSGDYLIQANVSISGAKELIARIKIYIKTDNGVDSTNQVLFNGSSCNPSLSVIVYVPVGGIISLGWATENLQANVNCGDPTIKLWGANLNATLLREHGD